MQTGTLAPELEVSRWFNAPAAPTLAALRSRVVLVEAFQMLCPAACRTGCRRRSGCGRSSIARTWR